MKSLTVDPVNGLVYGVRGGVVGQMSEFGYIRVTLPGTRKPRLRKFAHQLVWEHVNGPIPDGMDINHKNGIKTDNRIENLELATRSENVKHAYEMGLLSRMAGERHHQAKLTWDQVREIRARGTTMSRRALANDYGVSSSTIQEILTGGIWRES